ncbi:hypothetical protein D3C84_801860 [compost metagenome]
MLVDLFGHAQQRPTLLTLITCRLRGGVGKKRRTQGIAGCRLPAHRLRRRHPLAVLVQLRLQFVDHALIQPGYLDAALQACQRPLGRRLMRRRKAAALQGRQCFP